MLLACDYIYMLKDWELSKGAKLELDVAIFSVSSSMAGNGELTLYNGIGNKVLSLHLELENRGRTVISR